MLELVGYLRFLVLRLVFCYVELLQHGYPMETQTLEIIAKKQKERLERTMAKLAKKKKAEHDALAAKFVKAFDSDTLKAWSELTDLERKEAAEKISENIKLRVGTHKRSTASTPTFKPFQA